MLYLKKDGLIFFPQQKVHFVEWPITKTNARMLFCAREVLSQMTWKCHQDTCSHSFSAFAGVPWWRWTHKWTKSFVNSKFLFLFFALQCLLSLFNPQQHRCESIFNLAITSRDAFKRVTRKRNALAAIQSWLGKILQRKYFQGLLFMQIFGNRKSFQLTELIVSF